MKKEDLLSLAKIACETIMSTFTPYQLPPAGHFHYHQSVFLDSMYRLYQVTDDETYFEYIKGYYDSLIDENGNLYFDRDQLDSLQVGTLLFPLYEKTKDERYLIVAKRLMHIIYSINKTSEGGFWHKDKYPYQMWLDGLYMSGPFLLQCAHYFQMPDLVFQVLMQEKLMRKHMYNPSTGLLYHAWDEKKVQPWASPETGCSPEVWGRSAGWYGVALVELLKLLPKYSPAREDIKDKLKNYSKVLLGYQDKESHCWYQIVDKPEREDNWLESSGSALFVYIIARSVSLGLLDESYKEVVEDAFKGIIKEMVTIEDNKFSLNSICIGTSAGVYDYYIERPTSINDLHGVGAFIWALLAIYDLKDE
ncbi:glycoside hydrolase family 88 protein [Amphibacillus sp. MSJ-3]|uniref:glycoside hydrolase family 88/105 protein n=1 Tax=Amphibacillus sp. MSJ-3 TaxID=2841505 RepID=UPI001C0F3183|nr:glycoside hydrolase family 88 protein [Amphibacillus sp. MSJ-3]MBU5594251.1 glycoside hydrolase family 88 protein [Amphibacillus sp. MSJ-3]